MSLTPQMNDKPDHVNVTKNVIKNVIETPTADLSRNPSQDSWRAPS
jgi:hypothetical protein